MSTQERPPGPTGLSGALELLAFARDPLNTVVGLHERYGPMMHVRLPKAPLSVLFEPAGVEQLFNLPTRAIRKDPTTRSLRQLLGQGLIPADGDPWQRSRRMIAPMLLRRRVRLYADDLVRLAGDYVDGLDGGVRDVGADLLDLTLRGMSLAMFGPDVALDTASMAEGLGAFSTGFYRENKTLLRFLPKRVPTPGRARTRRGIAAVDAAIHGAIADRRRLPPGDDLLSQLLDARDDDGRGLTDLQVRDECVNLLLAGNETTALAVAFALFELARAPQDWLALRDEVRALLGERPPTAADLAALPRLDAALKEGMRLYPPIWVVGRELIEPATIAGFPMPAGAHVGACQYVVHRDPRWYPDPEAYRPSRWTSGETAKNPKYAYFPFGGGPRVCVGSHFAMMQAGLILAVVAQRCEIAPASDGPLALTPSVSLRPTHGVPLRLTPAR